MNPSIKALNTKLTWERDELQVRLQELDIECKHIQQKLSDLEQQVHSSIQPLVRINPEVEISRLNFMVQLQQQKAECKDILNQHQALALQLKNKLQRKETELRMLEKYMEKEHQLHQQQESKEQELSMEEWVLQRRNRS